MNTVDLITETKSGRPLGRKNIESLIRGYSDGTIPDYQMAAWAMAVCLKGLGEPDTVALTQAMVESGRVLDWDESQPIVDKHSTGGIGDKTSLIVVPLLATCDVLVPKLSGRGLGTTGGTLDKLESIPGFKVHRSIDELQRQVRQIGCAIVSASEELAPADKRLYSLRDVTGTVDSLPLIAASILSKKLSEGLDALVLDVKAGSGALMKTESNARQLAELLVEISGQLGLTTTAVLTDMNEPLGSMIGNACEVSEAASTLRGEIENDLKDVALELASEVLVASNKQTDLPQARSMLQQRLDSGAAFAKFEELIAFQGGDLAALKRLAPAVEVASPAAGYVNSINGESLGRLSVSLGGGRQVVTDEIDHGVGAELLVRPGTKIERNQPWLRVYTREPLNPSQQVLAESALTITETSPKLRPKILGSIRSNQVT